MQVELSDSWIHALRVTLLVCAFAGFAWALLASRRQTSRASAHLDARLETALGEIRKLSAQVTTLSRDFETVTAKLTQTTARPAAPSAVSVNTRGYETAIRMARSGASIDEIVTSCGTTRAEAKLLRRLHECSEPRRADAESEKIA